MYELMPVTFPTGKLTLLRYSLYECVTSKPLNEILPLLAPQVEGLVIEVNAIGAPELTTIVFSDTVSDEHP